MGKLLCEKNLRDVWCRNESVRAEIGPILQTHARTHARTNARTHQRTHARTHARASYSSIDMHDDSTTAVRCVVGVTERFEVKVGLHQGSALSPCLLCNGD